MDQINEFVDERQKAWCIQCGAWIEEVDTNRDHVPSKVFLRKPYPENLPVVVTCVACNNGFSPDEEYLHLLLHCVLTGSTDPEQHPDAKIARALQRHEKLRMRIERSKTEYRTIGGETRCVWKPDKVRTERVVAKNARGHVFYEYGEPLLSEPEHVWTRPLAAMTASEHEEFEKDGVAQELGRFARSGQSDDDARAHRAGYVGWLGHCTGRRLPVPRAAALRDSRQVRALRIPRDRGVLARPLNRAMAGSARAVEPRL